MRTHFFTLFACLLMTVSVSCQKEVGSPLPQGGEGCCEIEVVCEDLSSDDASFGNTKSSVLADAYDMISNVGVVVYDTNGQFVCRQYFNDPSKISINFPDISQAYNVYLLGNIERTKFESLNTSGDFKNCILSFEKDAYAGFIQNGFPLGGFFPNFVPTSKTRLSVKRLTGFYRISKASTDFTIKDFSIVNAALKVTPYTDSKNCDIFTRKGDLSLSAQDLGKLNSATSKENGPIIYFLENLQGDLLSASATAADKIESNILGGKKDKCTYFEYTTVNSRGREDVRRFYLGQNATNNFDIKRNTIIDIIINDVENDDDGVIFISANDDEFFVKADLGYEEGVMPANRFVPACFDAYDIADHFIINDFEVHGTGDLKKKYAGMAYTVNVYISNDSMKGVLNSDWTKIDLSRCHKRTASGTIFDSGDSEYFDIKLPAWGYYVFFGLQIVFSNGDSYWARFDGSCPTSNYKTDVALISNYDCYMIPLYDAANPITQTYTYVDQGDPTYDVLTSEVKFGIIAGTDDFAYYSGRDARKLPAFSFKTNHQTKDVEFRIPAGLEPNTWYILDNGNTLATYGLYSINNVNNSLVPQNWDSQYLWYSITDKWKRIEVSQDGTALTSGTDWSNPGSVWLLAGYYDVDYYGREGDRNDLWKPTEPYYETGWIKINDMHYEKYQITFVSE